MSLRTLATEAVILAGMTVVLYTSAYFYEFGYLMHFGAPTHFIEVSISQMIPVCAVALSICVIYFCFTYPGVGFLSNLSSRTSLIVLLAFIAYAIAHHLLRFPPYIMNFLTIVYLLSIVPLKLSKSDFRDCGLESLSAVLCNPCHRFFRWDSLMQT